MENGKKGAFALQETENYKGQPGLTKREYFAAAALTGLLAGGFNIHEDMDVAAVQIADQLLKQLN